MKENLHLEYNLDVILACIVHVPESSQVHFILVFENCDKSKPNYKFMRFSNSSFSSFYSSNHILLNFQPLHSY